MVIPSSDSQNRPSSFAQGRVFAPPSLLCMAGLGSGIRDQRRGLGGRGEGSAGPQGEGRLLSTQSKVKMMICSSSAMACLKLITL